MADAVDVGGDGARVVRVDAGRDHGALAPGEPARHQHRLGGGAGRVVHGRVGDRQAEDLADDRLELEDDLQGALRHLGLVGRVRGVELAAVEELVRRGREVVVVRAGAQEREHARRRVAGGQILQLAHQRGLVHARRQIERPRQPRLGRDGAVERVERGQVDRREHRGDLLAGVGQVAHDGLGSGNALGLQCDAGLEQLRVGGGVEELVELGRVRRLQRDHPRRLPAVLVDELGLVLEGRVDARDLAAQGREEIAERLDALDRAERLPGRQRVARLHVEVHQGDVAELIDREGGDAHQHLVPARLRPLVVLGVPPVGLHFVAGHVVFLPGLRSSLVRVTRGAPGDAGRHLAGDVRRACRTAS